MRKTYAFASVVQNAMNSAWGGATPRDTAARAMFESMYLRRVPFWDRVSPTFWLAFYLTK